MAINKSAVTASLRLSVQTGTNSKGEPLVQNRDYKGLKPGATDVNVFTTAQALASLMSIPVSRISRIDQNALVEA
ncbi:DUF1659 domain-containing protein [Heliobacillus mobilis]|uniref:DUF1659 domain-containing protein n=2 Tax=Heliobacterium TaxID=2697 RepID=A0A6I3SNC0_HELMO|nr:MULTISPECIES: DUF1659 domain-containing protein [Heliobacterium]MBC9785342.1 DUF1659 domain-containing protein [Heliobacterium chlorum]MTV50520.1 DUF1659 domain-containing protein [Heliobacterium mobile]